jgi:hypothetical protein
VHNCGAQPLRRAAIPTRPPTVFSIKSACAGQFRPPLGLRGSDQHCSSGRHFGGARDFNGQVYNVSRRGKANESGLCLPSSRPEARSTNPMIGSRAYPGDASGSRWARHEEGAFATAQHLMVRSRRQAAVPTAPPQEATLSPESTSWYSRCRALEIGRVVNIPFNMLGRQRNVRPAWQKPRAPGSLDRVVAMQ